MQLGYGKGSTGLSRCTFYGLSVMSEGQGFLTELMVLLQKKAPLCSSGIAYTC